MTVADDEVGRGGAWSDRVAEHTDRFNHRHLHTRSA
jgi:hypothetical protein